MIDWTSAALAAPLLFLGYMVIASPDIVRAILWLGAVLGWTAVLYASLDAGFIAGVQLLLYAGGVITLMIVGVMVTLRTRGASADDRRGTPDWKAALSALATFVVMAATLTGTQWPAQSPPADMSTKRIGELLLTEHALAFEVLSLLLLAGMLGAIVLTRRQSEELAEKREGGRAAAFQPGARPQLNPQLRQQP